MALMGSQGAMTPRPQREPAGLLLGQVQLPQADVHLPEEHVLPESLLAQHAQLELALLQVPPGDAVVHQLQTDQARGGAGGERGKVRRPRGTGLLLRSLLV